MCYGRSKYWDTYAPFLEEFYNNQPWKWLVDLNECLLRYFLQELAIKVEFIGASEHGFRGTKSDLVLDHCRQLGGDACVLGEQGRNYLVESDFTRDGISIYYQDYIHPRYEQRFGEFNSHLSIVDLLFNCGPESRTILLSGNVSRADMEEAVGQQSAARVISLGDKSEKVS